MSKKIIQREALAPILQSFRKTNKKIVFTNGCFDLLHIGHIRYLNECKQHGDILVVGLNTDDSVRQIKGDTRPILPLDERAELLAALETVDFVVPFPETIPLPTIITLKPDVLIKGADYTLDTIVGRDEVISWGGCVETVPLVEGQSTSNIIDRIVERFGKT